MLVSAGVGSAYFLKCLFVFF